MLKIKHPHEKSKEKATNSNANILKSTALCSKQEKQIKEIHSRRVSIFGACLYANKI
jgi:hypothetical protein